LAEMEDVNEPLDSIETHYSPPSRDDSRWMFDYQALYWEIRAKLMGGWIIQDKQNNYVIKKPKGVNPLLNGDGVEETMALINGFISKIQGITIVDEERVLTLCRDLYVKLSQLYYVNMERYEITPEKASVVLRMVMNLFETNLRKSLGGMSMKMIGQSERIVETRAEQPKKRFGIF
jgi:hypothetical protein